MRDVALRFTIHVLRLRLMKDVFLLEFLTFYEFFVALLMGFAALCFFIWAILTGNFKDVEAIKYKVYEMEVVHEEGRKGKNR